ncbi:TonB-dependent receptor, partial [bacterium]
MQKKFLGLFFLTCLFVTAFSGSLYAQQTRTVTGKVVDEGGTPLAGASIVVKGTLTGVASGIDGTFFLEVPQGSNTLVVSFVGMETTEAEVTTGPMLVTVAASRTLLNEVVVIGYGTIRRSEVTSAISSVKSEEIKNLSVAGVDQALQGKVSGLTVINNSGQPGGGVSVRVRGITTINSNAPLIVIDGVPLTGTPV